MRALLFFSLKFYFASLYFCADFDSYEINQLEVTPIYDIILFNDIAEVIKDFDNDLNTPPDAKSLALESESDENIENLLLEYQHYLDKAHKQHVKYLEKVTGKNKIPLLRHDKYPKKNGLKTTFEDFYPFSSKTQQIFPKLQTLSRGFKGDTEFSYTTSRSVSPNLFEPTYDRHYPFSNIQRSNTLSSCYCKSNEIPCNCGCKQCIIQFDSINSSFNTKSPLYYENSKDPFIQREGKTDNDFKIRIKVDIKLPKIIERIANVFSKKDQGSSEPDPTSRKEYSMNYITPYYNFPNPSDLLGFNSMPRMSESIPLQRITIHKKKKFRSNSNKKHKKKTFNVHEIQTDKKTAAKLETNETMNQNKNETLQGKNNILYKNNMTNNISENINYTPINKSQNPENSNLKMNSKEIIYLTLNISNENHTDEINKLENSIETGYFKTKDNFTELILNREKRDAVNKNTSESVDLSVKPLNMLNETHEKKLDKILNDSTLSYWPESQNESSETLTNSSKNINSLIFDIEKRKSKFNMSSDNVRNNHSIALERAIFGEVDWNDVDTVAPVFISFVGKYIHGVLTFCSDSVCHSMKCANKTCVHRNCNIENRYNKMGHCLGNNSTDSVAKMESIMDLPSNLALEIVDILQDKMLGKMFGKITICIGIKCVTFVASKKTTIKYKCTSKEITSSSECPYNKQR
ncbi:probable serine/threonine-protein kinase DDB_G0286465 [Pieris rapae]|uniref:probable serine/threonine-protein kinase DDB_G0286465 n=1 Tax=Pieris rapae TaxID=64459 RepID=UPI001E2806E4|nr:probable serine/threonine-protein kinase DDB_G0286465 [Pieris rapae]